MEDHPVLPDITSATGVHILLRVSFDLALIAVGGLMLATAAAFLLGRPALGMLTAIGSFVAALGAARIHAGRLQLERGHV